MGITLRWRCLLGYQLKTSHLMACVRMAVAFPPYSCQMNSDKVEQTVLWRPGQKVSRRQTLVCFESPEFDSQLLGACLQHEFWPGVLLKVWRGLPSLFVVREAYLSLSSHHCRGCIGDPVYAGSCHSARFTTETNWAWSGCPGEVVSEATRVLISVLGKADTVTKLLPLLVCLRNF